MKLTKSQLKKIIKEEFTAVLKEDYDPGLPYVSPFSPEEIEAAKAFTAKQKEREEKYGPTTYGDDIDTPGLQEQMQTAILAAVEALDAGDMEAARAAFPESLLKDLRPYSGPVGKLPTKAQLASQAGYDI
jgi:hypothetical protein